MANACPAGPAQHVISPAPRPAGFDATRPRSAYALGLRDGSGAGSAHSLDIVEQRACRCSPGQHAIYLPTLKSALEVQLSLSVALTSDATLLLVLAIVLSVSLPCPRPREADPVRCMVRRTSHLLLPPLGRERARQLGPVGLCFALPESSPPSSPCSAGVSVAWVCT